jgi:hypothetical protein
VPTSVPVVDFSVINDAVNDQGAGGFIQFINIFSGGALGRMAVFGLGIMPYITSSIIMQLLTVVILACRRCRSRARWASRRSTSTRACSRWCWRCCSPPASPSCSTQSQQNIPDIFPPETFTGPTSR